MLIKNKWILRLIIYSIAIGLEKSLKSIINKTPKKPIVTDNNLLELNLSSLVKKWANIKVIIGYLWKIL